MVVAFCRDRRAALARRERDRLEPEEMGERSWSAELPLIDRVPALGMADAVHVATARETESVERGHEVESAVLPVERRRVACTGLALCPQVDCVAVE